MVMHLNHIQQASGKDPILQQRRMTAVLTGGGGGRVINTVSVIRHTQKPEAKADENF